MISCLRRALAALDAVDERTKRVIAVAGVTYVGRFVQGIAVLVTLPIARASLPPDLFGVWMMLSSLVAFMAFADLGIGNGVLNQSTRAKATGDAELLRRTLASGYVVTGGVGCLLFASWLVWSSFSIEPTILAGSVSAENRSEVLRALSYFAFIFAVNIPASLILRLQLGMQQGYFNGLNQIVCSVMSMLLIPLALYHGGGVPELILATIGVQATVNVVNSLVWLNFHDMLGVRFWRRSVDMLSVSLLLRTGVIFFFLQLSAAFAFQSDSIVITHTLGQGEYGDFAVVQKLFLFVSMLLSAALVGLWPAFGDAIASQNKDWVRKALVRGAAITATVAIIAVGVLAISMPWILRNWMHSTINLSWGLVYALAAWTVIDAVAGVFAAYMNGANLLRVQLVFAVGMALTAFATKWILTPVLGTAGAVLSTILAYCLVSVPGQVYIFKRRVSF